MATLQSSPLCAPVGLLLLLIGVIYSHLRGIQAKPSEFWCNRQARTIMEKRMEGLKTDMATCVGADRLSSPVQLPCVSVQTTEWANKSLQQKHAEVFGAFQEFQHRVQESMNQTTSECQTSLLGKLQNHITNYLAIIVRLQIQNDTVTPSHSAVQNCSNVSSTGEVLDQYQNLIRGKLERLAVDLQDNTSKEEHRTTKTKRPCG